ncbi:MAG: tetratricopeptide repeat protein [Candidatus Melainabacteria bacterium]|nr:tetratricopeptide repeat protein [Candidatus Melainabacteria bacterium]
MTEESTTNKKKRMLEEAQETSSFSEKSFGPEQIVEMNQDLPEQSMVLFLPPDFDKRFLPVKARALRNWWETDDKTRMHARFCLPLTMASGLGFYILSPATFTVEWDGDPTHDTEVTIIDGASHAQIDNHSSFGSFTVQARFIGRTKNIGDFIYVKGVANQYRQPFHVMEAMIESWWTPSEFGIVCLVNQAGKFTIKKGEPLAQMFVVNAVQAQYGLATADGYPPFWDEWTERRKPEIYNGRNMDYLRGVLPDQTPVCPHMKNWNEPTQIPNLAVGQTVNQFWAAGEVARRAGHQEDAIKNYNSALQLAEEREEVTENLLYSLMSVAREFQNLDNQHQAMEYIQKCITMSERYFHPGLEFTADLFTDLAYSYRTLREFDKAQTNLVESLRRKRAEGATPMSLARTLIDLGTLHDFCGRRDQAAPFLTEAREIYAAANLPDDDTKNLYLKNVYACLLTHIGKYDEAEPLYFEVIKQRSIIFGEDSIDVAFTYNDLGFHYKSMGKFDEAEKMFVKCLESRKKQLGPDDLEVAAAHEDLSWMFREAGNFASAKKQLESVLAIRKKKLAARDPLIAATYLAIADVCLELGDGAAAAQARKNAESN